MSLLLVVNGWLFARYADIPNQQPTTNYYLQKNLTHQ